ncbi:MAG: type II secretion system inner membrane protein GspF [Burkholderiales bacterium]|jgi:general secretion pathway protein F|nr:type II secretion system inner membrane protein GspF [Betaproteobacteria bacterium]
MPGFKFLAYDIDGREQRGVIESDSPRLARATLREQGLFPLDVALIEAANDASNNPGLGSFGRRTDSLSTEQLAGITRQLATLVGAGLTIEGALGALVEQAETERERQVVAQLRASIREGQSLAQAMSLFPQSFSELYRTLVGAGETSGKLPEVLLKLADYVEDQQAMKQKLITAMVYPAIVVVICALVVIGLMLYVVPQVVGVFDATKQTLPLMTRALLGLSTLLKLTWWFWIIAAIAATVAFRFAMRQTPQRRRFHALLLRLPIIGRLIRVREASQLAATLSILVGSGVPVLAAMNAGVGVVSNLPMRDALERAANQVREGVSLSRALQSQNTKPALFPPVMLHLVASGEASGRLPETLASAARQQQRELETRTARLAALIEPAMIVIMGIIVLCIVLAVLLPIFELNQLVSR